MIPDQKTNRYVRICESLDRLRERFLLGLAGIAHFIGVPGKKSDVYIGGKCAVYQRVEGASKIL